MQSESIFNGHESLLIENESLKAKVEKDERRLTLYEDEISRLHEIVRKLKREAFGPRRERWESTEQLVFNEAEACATAEELATEPEAAAEIEVPSHKRKRGKRKLR